MVLTTNGKPTAVLNTSLTVAKTLHQKLDQMIKSIESASGNHIMTTEELQGSLNKAYPPKEG
ncbi:hypothetical protein DN752_02100 [Echinicola strongylocentroti]|uniref:Uncharacterized protein n=1 Tax=Echinicola strongylocentroti TaxID=1795355 RepID=A0A2Z4IDQ7_9BACT|nr:hypothetical protein DN752_02100 [Echinicola strongylocentroti]